MTAYLSVLALFALAECGSASRIVVDGDNGFTGSGHWSLEVASDGGATITVDGAVSGRTGPAATLGLCALASKLNQKGVWRWGKDRTDAPGHTVRLYRGADLVSLYEVQSELVAEKATPELCAVLAFLREARNLVPGATPLDHRGRFQQYLAEQCPVVKPQ